MTTFLSILAALLVLSVFVVVHELGHFLAGRLLGFTVLEFSVGMGPAILKKEKNGILYALRAFPIGGMCRFYGEDEEAKDGKSFSSHPVWKRIIVVAAGPVMNILAAILFATVSLMSYGVYVDIPAYPEINAQLQELAEKYGVSKNAVVIAWILRHPAKMQPLTGTMNPARLAECAEGVNIRLTREEWYAIYRSAGNILP